MGQHNDSVFLLVDFNETIFYISIGAISQSETWGVIKLVWYSIYEPWQIIFYLSVAIGLELLRAF